MEIILIPKVFMISVLCFDLGHGITRERPDQYRYSFFVVFVCLFIVRKVFLCKKKLKKLHGTLENLRKPNDCINYS